MSADNLLPGAAVIVREPHAARATGSEQAHVAESRPDIFWVKGIDFDVRDRGQRSAGRDGAAGIQEHIALRHDVVPGGAAVVGAVNPRSELSAGRHCHIDAFPARRIGRRNLNLGDARTDEDVVPEDRPALAPIHGLQDADTGLSGGLIGRHSGGGVDDIGVTDIQDHAGDRGGHTAQGRVGDVIGQGSPVVAAVSCFPKAAVIRGNVVGVAAGIAPIHDDGRNITGHCRVVDALPGIARGARPHGAEGTGARS